MRHAVGHTRAWFHWTPPGRNENSVHRGFHSRAFTRGPSRTDGSCERSNDCYASQFIRISIISGESLGFESRVGTWREMPNLNNSLVCAAPSKSGTICSFPENDPAKRDRNGQVSEDAVYRPESSFSKLACAFRRVMKLPNRDRKSV